jgi:hypothetical protein
MLFQCLFESLLGGRDLEVRRYVAVVCQQGHWMNRAVVREHLSEGQAVAFCSRCGERLALPAPDAPVVSAGQLAEKAAGEHRTAHARSAFEEAIFRLKAYVAQHNIAGATCFISYAWGLSDQERWVEHSLAEDLVKAGLRVVLDRWDNARPGASVSRFIEKIDAADYVIVVGTPAYQRKYANEQPMNGYVVAAEGDLIGKRMIGTEMQKESVFSSAS